jgi:hypothetical protein
MAEFNKAIVALAMAVLVIIDQLWGIDLGAVSEETVTIVLAVLTPILVWLVPNWPTRRSP